MQSPEKTFSHLKEKHATIVALGDSNTQQNHWSYGHCTWVGLLGMGLYSVFPKGTTIINSGVSGDTAAGGLKRLERDVLRFEPDVVLIGFGTNDCVLTTPDCFRNDLKLLVSKIREKNPECIIILRTATPVINQYSGYEEEIYHSGEKQVTSKERAAFADAVRRVAEEEKTLLADHYTLWKNSMKSSCHGDLCMLMGNPVHLNHLGHRRIYHELMPLFGAYPRFFYEWERILEDEKL